MILATWNVLQRTPLDLRLAAFRDEFAPDVLALQEPSQAGAASCREWCGDRPAAGVAFDTRFPYERVVIDGLGLVSAYHSLTGEAFGEEAAATLYYQHNSAQPFHCDYGFVPASWASRLCSVVVLGVDRYAESDHRPVVVEVMEQAKAAHLTPKSARTREGSHAAATLVVEPDSIHRGRSQDCRNPEVLP